MVAIMSGGEPLIRKELEEIVRTFRQGCPRCGSSWSPTRRCSRPSVSESLKEAGVDEFLISLDFPDERHDEWRAIPGLFTKIGSFSPA